MLYPYPRQYPVEEVKIVLDYFMGTDESIAREDAIHAGWVVSGFALGKICGGGPEVVGRIRKVTPDTTVRGQKNFLVNLNKAWLDNKLQDLEASDPDLWHRLYKISDNLSVGCAYFSTLRDTSEPGDVSS